MEREDSSVVASSHCNLLYNSVTESENGAKLRHHSPCVSVFACVPGVGVCSGDHRRQGVAGVNLHHRRRRELPTAVPHRVPSQRRRRSIGVDGATESATAATAFYFAARFRERLTIHPSAQGAEQPTPGSSACSGRRRPSPARRAACRRSGSTR